MTRHQVNLRKPAMDGRVRGVGLRGLPEIFDAARVVLRLEPIAGQREGSLKQEINHLRVCRVEIVSVFEHRVCRGVVLKTKKHGAEERVRSEEVRPEADRTLERGAGLRESPQTEIAQAQVVKDLEGVRIELGCRLQGVGGFVVMPGLAV